MAIEADFLSAYTPPEGDTVYLDLGASATTRRVFTRTAAVDSSFAETNFVWNYPEARDVGGWDASQFGTAFTWNLRQYLPVEGFDTSVLGKPFVTGNFFSFVAPYTPALPIDANFGVVFLQKLIRPSGHNAEQYGSAHVSNEIPTIEAEGWESTQFGASTVENASRQLVVASIHPLVFGQTEIKHRFPVRPSGFVPTAFGILRAEHFLRYVAPSGKHSYTSGTAYVDHNPRYVSPTGKYSYQTGTALVGYNRTVETVSFSPTVFGTAQVKIFALEPSGWVSHSAPTQPRVSRNPQLAIESNPSASLDFGFALVYNARQYLQHNSTADTPLTQFGPLAWIYNGNRTVAPSGLHSMRFASTPAVVENAARALVATGLAQTQFGATRVSHWQQYILLDGISSLHVARYSAIYNNARVVAASGLASQAYGNASLENTRRYVLQHTGSHPVFGTAFAAYRIRTVLQTPPSTLPVPLPAPVISLYTRFVLPPSIPAPAVNSHVNVLGPYRKIIQPHTSKPSSVVSYNLLVKNKTPQLYPQGINSAEYGWPTRVEYRVRTLYASGSNAYQSGLHSLSLRNRTYFLTGFNSFGTTALHHVYNDQPDPPSVRSLYPLGFRLYEREQDRFGQAVLRFNLAYPEGLHSLRFGSETWIRVQGCSPIWYEPDTMRRFGVPSLNRPKVVDHKHWLSEAMGKPRISPHTIWCTPDTPAQARENHFPDEVFELIDGRREGTYRAEKAEPQWGEARISNQYRSLAARSVAYGIPNAPGATFYQVSDKTSVELSKRYLYPTSINSFTRGFPTLFPHTQSCLAWGQVSLQIGGPSVTLSDKTFRVYPLGIYTPPGTPEVQNKNRPVYPSGFLATQWGNNTPMVHYPRHFDPVGHSATEWGETWVTHRVREVVAEGFDTFISEEDWLLFDQRMRVWQRSEYIVGGSDSMQFGSASIRNKHHRISPYMIAPPRLCPFGTMVQYGP